MLRMGIRQREVTLELLFGDAFTKRVGIRITGMGSDYLRTTLRIQADRGAAPGLGALPPRPS